MTDKNEKITVRFAPSPTGILHMGSVRTALYNFLFARKNDARFLLRIEDTDKERSREEYTESIYENMRWLGLNWDGEVLKQSERTEIYKSKIKELMEKGLAYEAEEQKDSSGQKVIRIRNPGGKIKFKDLIRGEIEEDITDLGDFVIARNIEEPLYHFVVVVDDILSEVTHIIRGEDHISNTARQILIARSLEKKEDFKFAHLPLVLSEDKSKLSKRKHGELVSLSKYRNEGYESIAILNFLALIGWNPGTNEEIFTLDKLIENFDLSRVQKKGGVFNIEKLNWINKQHILLQDEKVKKNNFNREINKTKFGSNTKLSNEAFKNSLFKIITERIHRWGEVREMIEAGEYDYFFEEPELKRELIIWKKSSEEKTIKVLENILKIFKKSNSKEIWIKEIKTLADKEGKGEVFWPLRYSLSGREKSPDPITIINTLSNQECADRIQKAIILLKKIRNV